MTEVGELFAGRYRIESQLGQGGMGSVYPALDFVHRRGRLHRDVKLGNIWEWTQDKYSGSSEARVLRGGFWYSVPRHARVGPPQVRADESLRQRGIPLRPVTRF